jgi:hypothetical protein
MKFSVYTGRPSGPFVAIGKNQCRLLGFAEKYRGWHTYAKDRATLRAVQGLVKRGSLIVEGNQFRFPA